MHHPTLNRTLLSRTDRGIQYGQCFNGRGHQIRFSEGWFNVQQSLSSLTVTLWLCPCCPSLGVLKALGQVLEMVRKVCSLRSEGIELSSILHVDLGLDCFDEVGLGQQLDRMDQRVSVRSCNSGQLELIDLFEVQHSQQYLERGRMGKKVCDCQGGFTVHQTISLPKGVRTTFPLRLLI